MNAFNHHRRFTHRDSLEEFNRATHSDALREMQLVPAEELQPIVGTGTNWLPLMAFGLIFILTVIGVNA